MKNKFTLDDIQEFLEDIAIKWVDKVVYDSHTNKYRRAMMKDFNQPFIHLYLEIENDKRTTAVAHINNNEFVIKLSNVQINMTKEWAERLNQKLANKEL